jgi:transposase
MSDDCSSVTRFVGLDVHKNYLVAVVVDPQGHQLVGPRRTEYSTLARWIKQALTPQDAVVLEMTSNAYSLYDDLVPHVHSVTIVHPPHVQAITQARVKTDAKAAYTLARLHAAGLLEGVWIPPAEVRQLRALLSKRRKMVSLRTQAKNRLHAVLHQQRQASPAGELFTAERREWWLNQAQSAVEQAAIRSDLDTLAFATAQAAALEETVTDLASRDERVPLLVQLTGVSVVTAMTILAAIGPIERFSQPKKLVGYAGLGAAVHDSGQTHTTGHITKTGRRDLRTALVEAAQVAVEHDPHWRALHARCEPRLGHNKTVVAIARRMLVVVWHVLSQQTANRWATAETVAHKLLRHAYALHRTRRPARQSAAAYVRLQLDRLGLGADLTTVRLSAHRTLKLPPSGLTSPGTEPDSTG